MKLVIVESPTKVKTISKYLGKDYKVMASYGHIRDLAISGKDNLGVDIENNYAPVYEVYPRSKSTITKLKNAFEKSDGVLLATDPDREGEAISWHLAMTLDLDINTTPRLDFNEITPFGIKNALENQRTIDMDLVHSQETRRIIDRILGFKLSSLLQSKIKSKSAGRVQSAVLKLICDKEKEIGEFVPTEYWNIYAVLNDEKVKAKLIKVNDESPKINTEQEALNIISKIGDSLVVAEKKSEEKEYYARPPFTTSSLQQEAFNHLGFSAKKTMKIAQELYEGVETDKGYQGIITYMRTDSYRLSPIFINAAKKQIEELYGANYVGKAYSHKSDEKIQDAHEGIRPTDASITPKTIKDKLSKDQYKLYSLIYARALASMMKPRVQENTTFMLESNNMIFELNGVKIKFNGYSKLYGPFERSIDENAYPYNEKDTIKIVEVEKEQKFTLPPSRFSEAKLVKTMEELGIGRPSTYASTIDILLDRGYISEKKGYITPTKQGMLTSEKLSEFFIKIVDAKYTAELEKQLDEVAIGKIKELDVLKDFDAEFQNQLDYAVLNMQEVEATKTGENCPVCGKPLIEKRGKFGDFIGCSGYPDCTFIKKIEKEIPENAKVCPKCGQGKLIVRKGKYGTFLACNRYPDCDYKESFKKKSFYSKKK